MTKSALYESVQMASLPQSDRKDESMLYACAYTHMQCVLSMQLVSRRVRRISVMNTKNFPETRKKQPKYEPIAT